MYYENMSKDELIAELNGLRTKMVLENENLSGSSENSDSLKETTNIFDDKEDMSFEKLFGLDVIQQIQDSFANATGVASIITYPNGEPITEPSNFSRLCYDIIRKTEKGLAKCIESDGKMCSSCSNDVELKRCLGIGLWDAGIPIIIDGVYLANWLIGQVRDDSQTEEEIRDYAKYIGANEEEMVEAFYEVPSMNKEQLKKITYLLDTFTVQFSLLAYKNLEQKKLINVLEKTQNELKVNERKFRGVFESITDIFHRTDVNGIITLISPSVYKLFGCKPQEVIGHNITDFTEDSDEKEKLMEVIKKEGFVKNYESTFVSKNGKRIFLSSNLDLIYDCDGNSNGLEGISRDITATKEAANALKESQRTLNTLMNNLPGIAYKCKTGKKCTMVFVSAGSYDLTGYLPIEIIDNKHIAYNDLIYDDDKKYVSRKVNEALKNKESFQLMYRIVTKSKKIKWVWEQGGGIYSSNNELIFLEGFIADITEQKEAEELYKENLQLLQTIIDTIPAPVYYKDENLKYTGCNKAFEEYSGKSRKEIIGKNSDYIYTKEIADKFFFWDNKLLREKNTQSFDLDLEYANGNNHNVVFHKALLDKSIGGLVGVIMDVTKQKDAEKALIETNQRLSLHLEKTPLGVIELNRNFEIIDWNKSAQKIFGYTKQEAIGKKIISFYSLKDEYKLYNDIISTKGANKSIHKNITKDGKEIVCNWYFTLLENEINEIVGIAAIFEDISKKVEIEEELKIYRESLEVLVEHRTVELKGVNQQLADEIEKQKESEKKVLHALEKEKELNELKSRFISTASHEFRTPLTAISSSVDLAEIFRKKQNLEKYYTHIDKIKKSVKFLTSLIDDVLLLNKSETGKLIFSPEMTNISDLVKIVFDEISAAATEKHNRILNYFLDRDELLFLDKKLIQLIIANLFLNAIKYSPNGGDVELKIEKKLDNLVIEVTDQGLGISPKDQSIIFEQFSRGSNIDNIDGSGLGLSIVQKSVELHGGDIKFKSQVNKGTHFKVTIPIKN